MKQTNIRKYGLWAALAAVCAAVLIFVAVQYRAERDQAESYGATAAGVDTLDQTIQMVLSGRADATLNAEVSFYDYMNVHPDANLKVVALTDEASQVAMPIRKEADSASLLAAVNQAIDELRAEGELTRISEKYFGKDITAGE